MKIQIHCSAPSHPGEQINISRFRNDITDAMHPDRSWNEHLVVRRGGKTAVMDSHASHELADDETEREALGNTLDLGRTRYNFTCYKCGNALAVRYGKLLPVLEKLGHAEVGAISLDGLRAIL
ncbi:hypothetical protein [Arthrobacter rhombi]|uniref:hypothetical protein n=1 Tax=Arthrobacter rhombi TaxID=71253 RepID=UPI003FD23898